jgi:hypothetical protein
MKIFCGLQAAAVALLVSAFASTPASATGDSKSVSPMECLPRGPGTTFSELTYGPYGITNPGTTNETVICPLPGDSESPWTANLGESAFLFVYYRTGAVSGTVSCSAFTGTAVTTAGATFSTSYTTPSMPANTRSNFILNLAETSGGYGYAPPGTLICTLSPKAALGWIFFRETTSTNTP